MKPRFISRYLITAVIVAVLCLASPAWPRALFSGPLDSPAGPFPRAVAAGDFNGDQILDLAVTNDNNSGTDKVNILLGVGTGIFEDPIHYPVGTSPLSEAVGDFNNDGKLDLVVVNWCCAGIGNLSLLFGNGDGTFQKQVKLKDTKHAALNVVVGDFNNDGNADLAFTNDRGHQHTYITVLLGNGDGSFQAAIRTDTHSRNPRNLVAGDLNGDGKLDLIVADYKGGKVGGTYILLGNGDGSFRVSLLDHYAPHAIALGDFNGDGKLDFVETYYSTRVAIHMGNGDGTFKTARHFPAGDRVGSLMVVSDFDGDGNLDVVVGDWKNGFIVNFLPGDGHGTLDPFTSYPLSPTNSPVNMIAADVNGDAKPDLVVTEYNRVVTVLLNTSLE